MYAAKRAGWGRAAVFDDGERQRAMRRLETEQDLRRAIERNEFELHYQQEFSVDASEIVGAEALIQ